MTEHAIRRMQALALRMTGLTHKEIAAQMGVSEQTVKNHMSELCVEHGVSLAVGVAWKLGWVTIPPEVEVHVHRPVCADCGREVPGEARIDPSGVARRYCQCERCHPACPRAPLRPSERHRVARADLCGPCDRGNHRVDGGHAETPSRARRRAERAALAPVRTPERDADAIEQLDALGIGFAGREP